MKLQSVTILLCASLGHAQTKIDLRYNARNPDFSAMTHTRPVQVGTTLPESCLNGELFVSSAAPDANSLYICNVPNTWSPVGLTGGSLGACTIDGAGNLSCPGSVFSGTGSLAGMLSLYEIGTNGNSFIGLLAPDFIPVSYTLKLPALPPQSGQVLQFAAPSNGVSEGSWASASGASGSGESSNGASASIITTYSDSPPCSASNAGQLFLIPTGAGIFGQCDGTKTRWMYNHFSVTPPGSKSAWTVKQADTGVANDDGSISISASATGAYNSLLKPVSNKTSATFAFTDQFAMYGSGSAQCMVMVTDAAGAWAWGDYSYIGGATYYGQAVNTIASDFSSRSGAPFSTITDGATNNGLKWFRVALSGGNIRFYRSTDGLTWMEYPYSARPDSSTAFTSVGFGCTTLGDANSAMMTVYSVVAQ